MSRNAGKGWAFGIGCVAILAMKHFGCGKTTEPASLSAGAAARPATQRAALSDDSRRRLHSTDDDRIEAIANNQKATVEDRLKAILEIAANRNKQQIFASIHPVGTAKSVVIHDVTVISWKQGRPTNRLEDALKFTVRYTLYWQSPLTTDGYTKVSQSYDAEVQRYIAGEILVTNGVTNSDAAYAIGYAAGTILSGVIDQSQK